MDAQQVSSILGVQQMANRPSIGLTPFAQPFLGSERLARLLEPTPTPEQADLAGIRLDPPGGRRRKQPRQEEAPGIEGQQLADFRVLKREFNAAVPLPIGVRVVLERAERAEEVNPGLRETVDLVGFRLPLPEQHRGDRLIVFPEAGHPLPLSHGPHRLLRWRRSCIRGDQRRCGHCDQKQTAGSSDGGLHGCQLIHGNIQFGRQRV